MVDELDLIETIKARPGVLMEARSDKPICERGPYSGSVCKMLGILRSHTALRCPAWRDGAPRMRSSTTENRIIRPAYKTVSELKPYVPLNDR